MKHILLQRISDDGIQTLGKAVIQDEHGNVYLRFVTLELPWKNNQRLISCIPPGEYEMFRRHSEKYGSHFHILNVPGRDMILIHTANFKRELKGCIAPGASHFDIDADGNKDVTSSRATLAQLQRELPEESKIIIIPVPIIT